MPNSDPIIVTQGFLISCEQNTSSAPQDKLQSRLSQLQTFMTSQTVFKQAIQTAVTQIASGQTLCPPKSIPELNQHTSTYQDTYYLLLLFQLYAAIQNNKQPIIESTINTLLCMNTKSKLPKIYLLLLDEIVMNIKFNKENVVKTYQDYANILEQLFEKISCDDTNKDNLRLRLINTLKKTLPSNLYSQTVKVIYDNLSKNTQPFESIMKLENFTTSAIICIELLHIRLKKLLENEQSTQQIHLCIQNIEDVNNTVYERINIESTSIPKTPDQTANHARITELKTIFEKLYNQIKQKSINDIQKSRVQTGNLIGHTLIGTQQHSSKPQYKTAVETLLANKLRENFPDVTVEIKSVSYKGTTYITIKSSVENIEKLKTYAPKNILNTANKSFLFLKKEQALLLYRKINESLENLPTLSSVHKPNIK